MISLAETRSALEAGATLVAIDASGVLHSVPDDVLGPATALVQPIRDALKLVTDQGLIRGSTDRDAVWAVERLVLSRVVIDELDDEYMSLSEVFQAVGSAGFEWGIRPMPSGL
ncbi:MAG: hypothetical protein R3258_06300 [Acidimicrobiia bacterium]|nr:hypothetical protein [Acidimicrobiia bacterium]